MKSKNANGMLHSNTTAWAATRCSFHAAKAVVMLEPDGRLHGPL